MKYFIYCLVILGIAATWYALPPRQIEVTRSSLPAIVSPTPAVVPSTMQKEEPSVQKSTPTPVKKPLSQPISATVPLVPVQPVPIPPLPKAPQPIEDRAINLQSVVVIKCLFKNAVTSAKLTVYGSGDIISADGYIVTARHVIDMAYTYAITGGKQGLVGYNLDSCDVAVPPEGTKTPTATEIRTLNPFTPVTEFAYRAQIAFVPPDVSPTGTSAPAGTSAPTGMSEAEHDFVDIALLRITSAINGALPHSFVVSPVKSAILPAQGDEVVTFGFPSGIPSYGNNFYLQGSIGQVKDLVGGDQFFKDQPVGMTAVMETIGGRSGSPVFWHGFIVGVVSSKEDYSRNTTIAGMYPLARFIEGKNIVISQ